MPSQDRRRRVLWEWGQPRRCEERLLCALLPDGRAQGHRLEPPHSPPPSHATLDISSIMKALPSGLHLDPQVSPKGPISTIVLRVRVSTYAFRWQLNSAIVAGKQPEKNWVNKPKCEFPEFSRENFSWLLFLWIFFPNNLKLKSQSVFFNWGIPDTQSYIGFRWLSKSSPL